MCCWSSARKRKWDFEDKQTKSCRENQSYWKWALQDHGTVWSAAKAELFLCVPRLTTITSGSTAARWLFSSSLMSLLPLPKPLLRLFGFLVIKMTTRRCLRPPQSDTFFSKPEETAADISDGLAIAGTALETSVLPCCQRAVISSVKSCFTVWWNWNVGRSICGRLIFGSTGEAGRLYVRREKFLSNLSASTASSILRYFFFFIIIE